MSDSSHRYKNLYFAIPAVGLIVSVLYMLLTGRLPTSVENTLDTNYIVVFLIMMLAGAVVTLGSYFMRGTQFSLNIEVAGLMSLSLATVIYGIMVLTYGEFLISVGATLSICFGFVCMVRMFEVRATINEREEARRLCLKHQIDADELIARSEDEGRAT